MVALGRPKHRDAPSTGTGEWGSGGNIFEPKLRLTIEGALACSLRPSGRRGAPLARSAQNL